MDIIWWISALGLFVDYISTQITIEVCPQPTPTVGICSSGSTRTRCTSNLQCRPGFLCCLQGCGRMCKPALTVRQHTRSGVCPVPPPLTDVICPPGFKNACRLDSDCIADFKCCYHPCGSKCVNPFQQSRLLKTGSCPNPLTLDGGPCPGSITDKCSSNSDCASDLKCCIHPCGRMCLNPAKSISVMKPGICPMPHHTMCYLPRRDRCSTDANCEGRSKCCSHPCGRNCVPAQSPTNPNGSRQSLIAPSLWPSRTLPSRNLNVTIEVCPQPTPTVGICSSGSTRTRCTSNLQCRPGFLCCLQGCGRMCKPALTVRQHTRSGVCPVPPPLTDVICPPGFKNACRLDSDCIADFKCCYHPCGSKCVNPFQQSRLLKTGSCPNPLTLDGGPCPGSITDKCSSNSDCASDLKCCIHPCGRMCLNPAKSISVMKPGICPMPHHTMCYLPRRDRCSTDANCEGRSKCCSHPCGRNCVPAQSPTNPNGSRQSLIAPSLWPSRTLPSRNLNVVIEARLPVPGPFIKSGVCPIQRDFSKKCYQKRDYCTTDGSCPGSLKCCRQPCGKRCTTPESGFDLLPVKGCPPVDPFVKPNCNLPFLRRCANDGDCSPVEQCCPGLCGNNCFPKPPVCSKNPCGNLHIKCQFGQERDANGCLLCKCRNNISNPLCPPGQIIVNCFVDPCKFATCNNLAAHECKSNYCGGCNAVFYDISGNEVICSEASY